MCQWTIKTIDHVRHIGKLSSGKTPGKTTAVKQHLHDKLWHNFLFHCDNYCIHHLSIVLSIYQCKCILYRELISQQNKCNSIYTASKSKFSSQDSSELNYRYLNNCHVHKHLNDHDSHRGRRSLEMDFNLHLDRAINVLNKCQILYLVSNAHPWYHICTFIYHDFDHQR